MLVSFWMDMGYRDQAIDGRMGRDIDERIPCLMGSRLLAVAYLWRLAKDRDEPFAA
jgi:hypothetical protein